MFPKALSGIQAGYLTGYVDVPLEDSNGNVYFVATGLVLNNFGSGDTVLYEFYNGSAWVTYGGAGTPYVQNCAMRARAYNSIYDVYGPYITSATNTNAPVGGEAGLVASINAANTGGWGVTGTSVSGSQYDITFTGVPVGIRNLSLEASFSQNFSGFPFNSFAAVSASTATSTLPLTAFLSVGIRSGACSVILYYPYSFPDGVSGNVGLAAGSIP